MRNPVINLVCTRTTAGDHTALQRWYADHVQLLLGTEQLGKAQLFRSNALAGELQAHEPEYVCVYDFESLAGFNAFESSEEKARAGELTNSAVGRSSVEIVQRTQFERWINRRYEPSDQTYWALQMRGALTPSLDLTRACADVIEQLRSECAFSSAQVFGHAQGIFVPVGHASSRAGAVQKLARTWHQAWAQASQQPVYGRLPTDLTMTWSLQLHAHTQWLR
jgi:hypothetical protein